MNLPVEKSYASSKIKGELPFRKSLGFWQRTINKDGEIEIGGYCF